MAKKTDAPISNLPQTSPEGDMMKKISILSSLASSCENPALKDALAGMEHGDRLYKLFVKAVHAEIQEIMGNTSKNDTSRNQLQTTEEMARALYGMVQTMYNMTAAVTQGPLIKTLAIINDNFNGGNLLEQLAAAAARPLPAVQVPQYQAPAQPSQDAPPVAQQAAPTQAAVPGTPPVKKRYAGSEDRPTPPALPPRGGGVSGLY